MYDTSTNPASPILLQAGANRVIVDPARGGRLASWTVAGEELLVGPPDETDTSIHWGCFVMAPWPGRLAGGRFDWRGRTVQVRRTHGRHAIHGLTWNRPWAVDSVSATSATLSIELPRDEWPMGGLVRQRVRLSEGGLLLEATVEADEAMPAALGWHPWFLRRGDPRLRIDADSYQLTTGLIPTGASGPVDGRTDLRAGPRLGRRRLDLCYLGASSPASVTWPDLELRIAFEPAPGPLVVYTPPDSFCVEPLTATPNALGIAAAGRGVAAPRLLDAGQTLRASLTIEPIARGHRVSASAGCHRGARSRGRSPAGDTSAPARRRSLSSRG